MGGWVGVGAVDHRFVHGVLCSVPPPHSTGDHTVTGDRAVSTLPKQSSDAAGDQTELEVIAMHGIQTNKSGTSDTHGWSCEATSK